MKHDELPEMATERYLMNELSEADRDAFEAHFYDCAVCATQVRAGFALRHAIDDMEYPKPVPLPSPAPQPQAQVHQIRSRFNPNQWMPIAASFLVAVFGMYLLAVQPMQRLIAQQSRPAVAHAVDLRVVRSEDPTPVDNSNGPSVLNVAIEGDDRATSYGYTITGAAGRTLYTGTVSAEEVKAHDTVPIVIRQGTLAPGEYTLSVDTKPRSSIYLFAVR
jgi:hypothetical protein